MVLNAIIVDDEEYSRKSLSYLIEVNCPKVKIIDMASSVSEARLLLKTRQVDIIYLDIAMPGENGFELLPDLERNETSVIFTTAFDQYAIKAIKASAIDYLLKPVNIHELQESVEKVLAWKALKLNQNLGNQTYTASLKSLSENINSSEEIRKISLPHSEGFKVKDIGDILYIEADNNYTQFHFINSEKMLVAKAMKEFEEVLNPAHFVRIHKSNIINLQYLKNYSNKNGFVVKMHNDIELTVSRRRSTEFIERVKAFLHK
ncbi:LytR/AlgR family response regulator transcription factor [Daejeonella oryzae]|uniref:LytR/AlgR family response regulator transcription factor n=1 Tax=Daejeonella oryzae TaxID=1122943 RepID=UPI000478A23A|nr:LytTR family DNA-binding domain-containing protein [Daejeonella oryzae]